MIFVTVGTQLPFERLIEGVDKWAAQNKEQSIYAQIGNQSTYSPRYSEFCENLDPEEFTKIFNNAKVIVSHAGMGTIISSLLAEKPIIIMARDADKGEHRNQHQSSTCKQFNNYVGCYIAKTEEELFELLSNSDQLKAGSESKENILFQEALSKEIDHLISL